MRHWLILILCCNFQATGFAQLPETSVYLASLRRNGKGLNLEAPRLISSDKGYNNHPYFSPDENYLFYVRSLDTVNTEIFRYDLKKKRSKRITKTRESEYSPKYTPDGEALSCVRVEQDGKTQRLYRYSMKGRKPEAIWPEAKNIGYYDWINGIEFIAMELPEPFYLVRRNIQRGQADTLAHSIGRSVTFFRTKNRLVYIDKSDSIRWVFRTVAPENLRVRRKPQVPIENPILCETLPGEEDYCILRDGSILMGHAGILYWRRNPFQHPESKWEPVADLNTWGIGRFYRMAVSPDNTQISLVVFKGNKP